MACIHFGNVPADSTLYIPFDTIASGSGSVTITGLAATDIEIYKNGSTTQRASDNGYTLLDTDGIDFDGITGIHGFSVDLSDNSDAGFYSVGGFYWVIVSSITVSGQTINLIAATFRIVPAEASAGIPDVNTVLIEDSDATDQIRDAVVDDATRIDASALNTASAAVGSDGTGLTEAGGTGDHLTAIQLPSNGLDNVTAWTVAITGNITGNLSGSVGSVTGNVGGIAGTLNTLDDLDTAQDSQHSTTQGKVDTAQADLDTLTGADGATLATSQPNYAPATVVALATVDSNVDAIKAKTDSLNFTVAGYADVNAYYIKGQGITGSGTPADPWSPA